MITLAQQTACPWLVDKLRAAVSFLNKSPESPHCNPLILNFLLTIERRHLSHRLKLKEFVEVSESPGQGSSLDLTSWAWISICGGIAWFREKAGGRALSLAVANATPSFPVRPMEMCIVAHQW